MKTRTLLSFLFCGISAVLHADDLEVEVTMIEPGVTNGAIDLTIQGGTAPFTVNWAGPGGFSSSSEDLIGLPAGTYTVTVADAHCGQAVLSVEIDTAEIVSGLDDLSFSADINIYPNPFADELLFSFYSKKIYQGKIKLVSLAGIVVIISEISVFIGLNTIQIEVPNLPSGPYLYSIENSEGIIDRKLLIH